MQDLFFISDNVAVSQCFCLWDCLSFTEHIKLSVGGFVTGNIIRNAIIRSIIKNPKLHFRIYSFTFYELLVECSRIHFSIFWDTYITIRISIIQTLTASSSLAPSMKCSNVYSKGRITRWYIRSTKHYSQFVYSIRFRSWIKYTTSWLTSDL